MPKDVCASISLVLFALFVLQWLDHVSLELPEYAEKIACEKTDNVSTTTKVPSAVTTTTTSSSTAQLQNLRLVFMGDSVTRYQYLSLAYFLRHKRWFDPHTKVNNIVNAHSFHHPLHPNEDWNEFFLQSNRMLHPMEICDCLRSSDGLTVLERRYFYDAENENLLLYINMNGNVTSPPGRGYYGRLNGDQVFGDGFAKRVGLPFGMQLMGNKSYEKEIQWDYSAWGDVIFHHIGSLDLAYRTFKKSSNDDNTDNAPTTNILINAGLHPHNFRDEDEATELVDALGSTGLKGTWKTTTFKLQELLDYQAALKFSHAQVVSPHVRKTDTLMCKLLGSCLNLTWMALVKPEFYFDELHFLEPVYRVLNEEYLDRLGLMPPGFDRLDRSTILVDEARDIKIPP